MKYFTFTHVKVFNAFYEIMKSKWLKSFFFLKTHATTIILIEKKYLTCKKNIKK